MNKKSQPSPLIQFIVSFAIPLIILTRFSSDSHLGPSKALLLALAFPILYEIYSIRIRRKVSMFSVLAVGGIIVTGAISLLGLSEGWLAIRRSVPYFAVTAALLISVRIKHPIVNAVLPQVLDMEKIMAVAKKNRSLPKIEHAIQVTSHVASGIFFVIGIVSYVLTRIIIMSPTNTAGFNEEYARLRVLSIPIITVPLIIGIVIAITYLTGRIEKLTDLKTEELLKKK